MRGIATIILCCCFVLASGQGVDSYGTSNSPVRIIPKSDIPFVSYNKNEVLRIEGLGFYKTLHTLDPNWNNNVPDSVFTLRVVDQNPDGYNGFKMSESLDDQSYWTRAGTPDGFTVVKNADFAPDHTKTAELFIYANSSPLRQNLHYPLIADSTYTVSLWAKLAEASSNNDMKIRVEVNDGVKYTISPDTTDKSWQRYSVSFTVDDTDSTSFFDMDFGATGVDVGDSIYVWGIQIEKGSTANTYKKTNGNVSEDGILYLTYMPDNGEIHVDDIMNLRDLSDVEIIQHSLNYAHITPNIKKVLLESDRTLTDTITIPINIILEGLSERQTLGGTMTYAKTTVYVDLADSTKTLFTYVGEGGDQLTGNGIRNISFIPMSRGYALLNTGNVINSVIENVHVASWLDTDFRWLQYGIILGAGALHNVIKNCSFLHIRSTGIWSISSSIMKIENCRVTEAAVGIRVSYAALYIDGFWGENLDSSLLFFNGNLCHIDRLYTEDVPKDTGVISNTLHIESASVFSVINSDLQGGQLVAHPQQTYIYLDSVRVAYIANNQIQASRKNLVTTANTGYVSWVSNVESNNSDEKVAEQLFSDIYNPERLNIIGSTGQNSFFETDNWIPRTKTNILKFRGYTAAQGSALTPDEGDIIYVTSTNGTFTNTGWWGYNGAAWEQLN